MNSTKLYLASTCIIFSLWSNHLAGQATYPTMLELAPETANEIEYKSQNGVHQLLTTGEDPHLETRPLKSQLSENHTILSFEYFCPKGVKQFQVFFGPPITEIHSAYKPNIDMAEGWVSYSSDLSNDMKDWGKPDDFLRLDFGRTKDVNIQIRNLQLREMTSREKEVAAKRNEKIAIDNAMHTNLQNYLNANYNSYVKQVIVNENNIRINGIAKTMKGVYLCEVPPYLDVTKPDTLIKVVPVKRLLFTESLERYITRNGIRYDRVLSKWILAQENVNGLQIISYARYPDKIRALYQLPDEKPISRKGIGGFSIGRPIGDLDDLDITSATVNIGLGQYMYLQPGPNRIEYSYNGKKYYFDKNKVDGFDRTFLAAAKRNIVVAVILLIDKIEKCPDREIGRLLQHPDMDPAGIYSMPNMTTPESVDCYAAALDFLASRYSRPDKKYGRIHHWIMHNEVDAGWQWTNMGEKTDLVFMDAYLKSMRMCYAVARNYNPHSEVFITLTHYWAWTSHPRFYPSKDLLDILLKYTRSEGDFQWAVAQHPYPESLFEPKTWLDKKAQFHMGTPLITFKNLKVLDQWIKSPEVLYMGSQKRTLWLSENGTNSKTYSEQDLKEQAAGFAYAWKVMKNLDGIDGFQWHNWMDNRHEGGLRIGLRRFPDDQDDPAGRKPVWYAYQAADTELENEVFAPYLEVIGIQNWSEISKFEK